MYISIRVETLHDLTASHDGGDRAGLTALLDQLQLHTHQLHDYFNEMQNSTTLELPLTDEDFAALHVSKKNDGWIREESPLYLFDNSTAP